MKKQSIIRLTATLVIIGLLGFLSTLFHFRVDLTQDKLYTLNKVTRSTLHDLSDTLYLHVYLDGELPVGFLRMQKALRETLDEFQVIAKEKIQVDFINPLDVANSKQRNDLLKRLDEAGIVSTSVQQRDTKGGLTQTVVYPGLLMECKGKQLAVNLLRNNPALSGEENVNLSIQNFEFALIDAISRLTTPRLPKVAFIHGHGELDEFQTGDIERALQQYFDMYRVEIQGDIHALDSFSTIIVAGPTSRVPEDDKIVIDQFVMRGGRVLWLVSPVLVSLDSLSTGSTTLAMPNPHNLDDMLFRYGVRLKNQVLQDARCAVVPVNVAPPNQNSRFVPAPWVYYPLLAPPATSPITRNLNLVLSKFISPIDTVGADFRVKKTVLLRSSDYTNLLQAPFFVNLSEISRSPDQHQFRFAHLPVGVLLEGQFRSAFKNRPLRQYNHGQPFVFVDTSAPTKMMVIADANIICNDVQHRPNGGVVLPLGYDRFTHQTYGNKELIINMLNYLNDETGLLALRNRDFKLRLLDRQAIAVSRLKWQLLNMLFPSCLLIFGGIVWTLIRRHRYSRKPLK